MRAAVLTELGAPLEIEELALRQPADHEVIVRTGPGRSSLASPTPSGFGLAVDGYVPLTQTGGS